MNKKYISAEELLKDSFELGSMIYQSGFLPDLLIGIWRGGCPIAIAVHEYFSYLGHHIDHIPIRAISYSGINQRNNEVTIEGLEYLKNNRNKINTVLLVDDVFDTGNSFNTIIKLIKAITPEIQLKIASPWYKPENNQTIIIPDFYLHKTNQWLIFPHELDGLSLMEIQKYKPDIYKIINKS